MREGKITYKDGNETRAIKGIILSEDDIFIEIQKYNDLYGSIRINKKFIIRAEETKKENKEEGKARNKGREASSKGVEDVG